MHKVCLPMVQLTVQPNRKPSSAPSRQSATMNRTSLLTQRLIPPKQSDEDIFETEVSSRYSGSSLAMDLLLNQDVRNETLQQHRKYLNGAVSGHASWLRTVFTLQGRTFHTFRLPWLVITLNATFWTLLAKYLPEDDDGTYDKRRRRYEQIEDETDEITGNAQVTFLLGCISLLVVFRLNQSAMRWWEVRTNWGVMIAETRALVNEVMEYANHSPRDRDDVVRWIGAYLIATKQYLRDERVIDPLELSGVLTAKQVKSIETVNNLPLFCVGEARHALARAFTVDEHTPFSLATKYTSDLRRIERAIHALMLQVGAMERVKATPLPIMYVTHLRTFIFLYLMLLPVACSREWGLRTIYMVSLIAYAILAADGASQEGEVPFQKGRVNHLDMEAFCIHGLDNITELVCHAENMRRRGNYTDEMISIDEEVCAEETEIDAGLGDVV